MFTVEKKIKNSLGRAGVLETPHGSIKTPAFAAVGTKATVKTLTPAQINETGIQVVLANTYHLFLQPGEKLIKQHGGLHRFMAWPGPIITDSGGFQVFSLGTGYGKNISKILKKSHENNTGQEEQGIKMASIDEDGVNFKNPTNGSMHRLTPERSIDIQHDLGADIIFAFDECTSPESSYAYQKEAMERTHRWAKRSLIRHQNNGEGKFKKFVRTVLKSEDTYLKQFLFGIVQGGRFEDLRKQSAKEMARMDFDGFGIGGSFDKQDINTALIWVNTLLPEEKPRHLLGIGEPTDLIRAVENGADLFDCVLPTRLARNGAIFTKKGRVNLLNRRFVNDARPLDENCACYTCKNFNTAYLSHLYRSKELLAFSLASIHNLYFINKLLSEAREHILNKTFVQFKEEFLSGYK